MKTLILLAALVALPMISIAQDTNSCSGEHKCEANQQQQQCRKQLKGKNKGNCDKQGKGEHKGGHGQHKGHCGK